ncbi:ribonuclease P protein component [Enterobacteriaceae endosymbiont of Donacia tomentosa]|uniref:ribonuclease P protein component n=1 Tax=Enterobacteriaceae endosymbiont of Donacia tomentosa TaxID=2675787 RepID=UPI00145708A4|nr:ribonuclease P protein component [Enterobacteriaceae endosymbiont of Donacia tomentosa]
MNNFNFSKKKRLLTSLDFDFVFKNPNKIYSKYFIILSRKNKIKYSRIGIIISKKKIYKTCNRNRIKRIIREYFRLNQHLLCILDYIIIISNKKIINLNNLNFKNYLENIWKIYKICLE